MKWTVLFFIVMAVVGKKAVADDSSVWQGPYEPLPHVTEYTSSGDESLDIVIAKIISATERRDWQEIRQYMTDYTISDVLERWNVKDDNSLFWGALHKALLLPGEFEDEGEEDSSYYVPLIEVDEKEIVTAHLDRHWSVDDFITVTDENVPVMEKPDLTSKRIGKFSYVDIVELKMTEMKSQASDGMTYRWIKVLMPTGHTGYILNNHLFHSIEDCKALFKFQNRKWMIDMFQAG